MKEEQNSKKLLGLPPRLPQSEPELKLTITLLGNRRQSELGTQSRLKLEKLIGVYPTAKVAGLWKRTLRRVYRETVQTDNSSE